MKRSPKKFHSLMNKVVCAWPSSTDAPSSSQPAALTVQLSMTYTPSSPVRSSEPQPTTPSAAASTPAGAPNRSIVMVPSRRGLYPYPQSCTYSYALLVLASPLQPVQQDRQRDQYRRHDHQPDDQIDPAHPRRRRALAALTALGHLSRLRRLAGAFGTEIGRRHDESMPHDRPAVTPPIVLRSRLWMLSTRSARSP